MKNHDKFVELVGAGVDFDSAYETAFAGEREKLRSRGHRDALTKSEAVAQMLERQGGACALCGSSERKLILDHDHRCGERGCSLCWRALICGRCNSGLGMFEDSPELLARAFAYVRGFE